MLKKVTRALVPGLFLLLSTAALAGPTDVVAKGLEDNVIKVIELKYLEVKDAQTVVRAILEMRHLAELSDRGLLVLSDTEAKVDAAIKLLQRLDVPARPAATAAAVPADPPPPPTLAAAKQ